MKAKDADLRDEYSSGLIKSAVALLAEFARASDAVCAALAFQLASAAFNDRLSGESKHDCALD